MKTYREYRVPSYLMEDTDYAASITAECRASKIILVVVPQERPTHEQIDEWIKIMYGEKEETCKKN